MTSFIKQFLAIVGLLCVVQSGIATEVDHVKSWGDLSKPGSYFSEIKTKVALPLLHRDFTVSYPQVNFNKSRFKLREANFK